MNFSLDNTSQALQRPKYERFRSRDIDVARARVGEVYCDHKLVAKRGNIDAFHYHAPFDGISFNYMGYGAECNIEPGCLNDFYLLQMPIKGRATIIGNDQQVDSNPSKGTIINPCVYTKMNWSEGCEQLLVQISKDKLHSSLNRCLGTKISGELNFDSTMSVENEQHIAWWRHVMAFIEEYSQDVSFYQTEAMLSNELDNLINGLLHSVTHNHSDALLNQQTSVLPKHVRQAVEHMRQYASENLSINDLVNLTGVSERSLFNGFKQSLGLTPMQFLLQTRLASVRAQLLNANPMEQLSITRIAIDNGFNQLGRFSSIYRSVFGELPSETLKRSTNN